LESNTNNSYIYVWPSKSEWKKIILNSQFAPWTRYTMTHSNAWPSNMLQVDSSLIYLDFIYMFLKLYKIGLILGKAPKKEFPNQDDSYGFFYHFSFWMITYVCGLFRFKHVPLNYTNLISLKLLMVHIFLKSNMWPTNHFKTSYVQCTGGFHGNSEAKQPKVRIILEWVTFLAVIGEDFGHNQLRS
jgi:hypothetical protein